MARVTIEDCLDTVDNRFELILVASRRARQLATGRVEPTVAPDGDKPTVLALREIAEGNINKQILDTPEEIYVKKEPPPFELTLANGF